MLTVHFLDTDEWQFDGETCSLITEIAEATDTQARTHLPLAEHLHLLVEPSSAVLADTGDNAVTMAPHLIRWRVDPNRGVAAVARGHLAKAFFHEAYHAARFRRLGHEASGGSWAHVAIGEGLATAFARDLGDAHEPWSIYDPTVIEGWAADLFAQPPDADMTQWKFAHDDGRQWIAFRVGTWLVDQVTARTGKTPAELVWTPAEEIEALCNVPSRDQCR